MDFVIVCGDGVFYFVCLRFFSLLKKKKTVYRCQEIRITKES